MRKTPSLEASSDCSEVLRATADILVRRANDIAVTPSKVRARQLARIVLQEAPGFGAIELRDPEVLKALQALDIGLATFRKELSEARKELVKKPAAYSRKPAKIAPEQGAVRTSPSLPKAEAAADVSSLVANIDRTLL